MTPAAQVFSASQILQEILDGKRAKSSLQQWSKTNRYAGSKDRRAIRDFVYDSLRIKRSALSKIKAPHSGRNWAVGVLLELNEDLDIWDSIFCCVFSVCVDCYTSFGGWPNLRRIG